MTDFGYRNGLMLSRNRHTRRDDPRKDYPDPKRPPKRKHHHHQLQTPNGPTDDVENTNGKNREEIYDSQISRRLLHEE